jgi:putative addiction module antidote
VEDSVGTIKIRKVGNSLGAVFPKELLARLRLGAGDTLFVTETSEGVVLSPYDPGFERQMDLARKIMREDRQVLRELAK